MQKDGSVLEINIWDTDPHPPASYLRKRNITNYWGKTLTFYPVMIYNCQPEDISYIKLTNVYLYKTEALRTLETSEPLEFEIYNAETDAPQS